MLIAVQGAYYLSRQVVEPRLGAFFLIALFGSVGRCEKKGVTSGSFGPALEFEVVRPRGEGAFPRVDCLEKFFYGCFLDAISVLIAVFGFGVLALGYFLFLSLSDCWIWGQILASTIFRLRRTSVWFAEAILRVDNWCESAIVGVLVRGRSSL